VGHQHIFQQEWVTELHAKAGAASIGSAGKALSSMDAYGNAMRFGYAPVRRKGRV
jgi:hypothetical protein